MFLILSKLILKFLFVWSLSASFFDNAFIISSCLYMIRSSICLMFLKSLVFYNDSLVLLLIVSYSDLNLFKFTYMAVMSFCILVDDEGIELFNSLIWNIISVNFVSNWSTLSNYYFNLLIVYFRASISSIEY
jgi:hypothetical protein